MDYFKKLPLVRYDLTTTEDLKQIVTLSDMTTRVAMSFDEKDAELLFEDYYVRDWITPERLSLQLYKTTDFYWVIMYLNSMFDLYHDWPLTEKEIEEFAKRLYPNQVKSTLLTDTFNVEVAPYPAGTDEIVINKSSITTNTPIYYTKIFAGVYTPISMCGTDTAKILDVTDSGNTITCTLSELTVESQDHPTIQPFVLPIDEYLNVDHYENLYGVTKDLSLLTDREESYVAVTKFDMMIRDNERKRLIKIVKPKFISIFVEKYFKTVIR